MPTRSLLVAFLTILFLASTVGTQVVFAQTPNSEFICPYLQAQAQKKGAATEASKPGCSPLENLEKLQLATTAYELGQLLGWSHHPWLSDCCYELACRLCPGSRIEKLAAERLSQGLSADPNLRMTELINQSEDLRQVQLEWARFWLEDHPSHLTPEQTPGQSHPPPPPPPRTLPSDVQRAPEAKQVVLNITIAEVPRGRFVKQEPHVKVLKPAAQEKLLHRIQALRDQGKARLLAEPRLTTLSGRQASFLHGFERAVEMPDGLARVGVQFEEFGTRISLTPTALKHGKVRLEIEPEVSRLDAAAGTTINGVLVPGRTTKRMNLTVEMKNGQTVAIGGFPALEGDEKEAKHRELIILVTTDLQPR